MIKALRPMISSKEMETETDFQLRVSRSRTHLFKVVFPNATNHHHTLFGGTALQLMDEVAFITATRFCRRKMVTISTDKIDFKIPIPADSIIELIGEVVRVGRTSLSVKVEIFQENMYQENSRQKSIEGQFVMVALDQNNKPTKI